MGHEAYDLTRFNPGRHADYETLEDFEVYSADGEKLGTIEQVYLPPADAPIREGGHIVLVKPNLLQRLFGADEVYIPGTAIQMVSRGEHKVVLALSKDVLASEDWTTPPTHLPPA